MGKFDLNDVLENLGAGKKSKKNRKQKSTPAPPPELATLADPIGSTTELARIDDNKELGIILLDRGIITPENLSDATRIVRQTPSKTVEGVLVELGADGTEIQKIIAEYAKLPFERIDHQNSDTYDLKFLNKLGIDTLEMEGRA